MSTKRVPKSAAHLDGRWLKPEDWAWAQKNLPIVCVDVLPIRFSSKEFTEIEAVGLITRATDQGTPGWCLIGGRVLRGESLAAAIRRQVKETLGDHMRVYLSRELNPACIAQYSPTGKTPFCFDPRQHSIGLTYAVEIRGSPDPRGEATAFDWFKPSHLPPSRQFGFNQDRIVERCLRNLQKGCLHLWQRHSRVD